MALGEFYKWSDNNTSDTTPQQEDVTCSKVLHNDDDGGNTFWWSWIWSNSLQIGVNQLASDANENLKTFANLLLSYGGVAGVVLEEYTQTFLNFHWGATFGLDLIIVLCLA